MGKFSIRSILAQNKSLLIIVLIIITTPWTWNILNYNLFLCFLLIMITIILAKLLLANRSHPVLILTLGCIFLVASIVNLRLGFDQDINRLNIDEKVQLDERHGYYAQDLGKLFLNRYALNYYKNYNPSFSKFQKNFFSVIDPNLYFFASHPRERKGVMEFEKYPSFYLLLFISGIFYILQRKNLITLVVYLLATAFMSGFVAPGFILGPILIYPFVSTVIFLGLINILHIFKEKL